MSLHGRVVVVPVGGAEAGAEAVTRRLAAEGATVVLVGETDEAGRLSAAIESSAPSAGRPAVFAGDDLDALVEFLTELFRPPAP